jgi:hypothetical protein
VDHTVPLALDNGVERLIGGVMNESVSSNSLLTRLSGTDDGTQHNEGPGGSTHRKRTGLKFWSTATIGALVLTGTSAELSQAQTTSTTTPPATSTIVGITSTTLGTTTTLGVTTSTVGAATTTVAGTATSTVAGTPTSLSPPNNYTLKPITITVSFPALSANVTGYRVDTLCSGSPASTDGVWKLSTNFALTSQPTAIQVPTNDKTLCTYRLFVLGTGSRSLVNPQTSTDTGPLTFRFVDKVDNVAIDPQTAIEVGPLPVSGLATLSFGVALSGTTGTTTTVVSGATTTAVASSTTLPVLTTTTRPLTATTAATVPAGETVVAPRRTKSRVKTVQTSKSKSKKICVKRSSGKCVKYKTRKR